MLLHTNREERKGMGMQVLVQGTVWWSVGFRYISLYYIGI
jgi:hypothetical protein